MIFSVFYSQRPSLVTVVEWIDYETLALLFGMVRLIKYIRTFFFYGEFKGYHNSAQMEIGI